MKQGSHGLQWERAPLPRTPMTRCRGHGAPVGVTVHPVAGGTLGDELCRRLEGHMLGWSHAGGRRRRGRLVYSQSAAEVYASPSCIRYLSEYGWRHAVNLRVRLRICASPSCRRVRARGGNMRVDRRDAPHHAAPPHRADDRAETAAIKGWWREGRRGQARPRKTWRPSSVRRSSSKRSRYFATFGEFTKNTTSRAVLSTTKLWRASSLRARPEGAGAPPPRGCSSLLPSAAPPRPSPLCP